MRRVFAEPIGAPETLRRYTGKLVDALVAELERRNLGARRLDLLFGRVDNRWEAVRIGTSRPDRDAKRLTRLLCDRIETVDPGFGVEVMTLAATIMGRVPREAITPSAEAGMVDRHAIPAAGLRGDRFETPHDRSAVPELVAMGPTGHLAVVPMARSRVSSSVRSGTRRGSRTSSRGRGPSRRT